MGPKVVPSTTAVMSSASGEQLVAVQVSVTGSPVHCRSGLHLRSNWTHGAGMQPTSHGELAVAGGAGGDWKTTGANSWHETLSYAGGGHTGIGIVCVFVSVVLRPASRCTLLPYTTLFRSVMSSASGEQLVAVQVSVTGSPVHCRAGLHLRSKFTHGCGMHATSHEELAVAGGAG